MRSDVSRGLIVLLFGLLGVVLAYIEQIAYESGYVINEFITGSVTIAGVQILTIVVALLIGVIFAVAVKG